MQGAGNGRTVFGACKDGLCGLTQDLIRRQPGETLGSRIHEHDVSVFISGDHAVGESLQGNGQPAALNGEGLGGLIFLSDIAASRYEVGNFGIIIYYGGEGIGFNIQLAIFNNGFQSFLWIGWLVERCPRSQFHALITHATLNICGQDKNRNIGIGLLQAPKQFDTAHAGQDQIADNHIGVLLFQHLQPLCSS